MFCDICESSDHVWLRCLKARAVKSAAVPRGFTVEGLGFFHIPHESSVKQRTKARSTVISVTDGVLSIQNVMVEVDSWRLGLECRRGGEQLLSHGVSFSLGAPAYGRVGVVHSKFQNAKLRIEERMVDKEVMPRVWVQFTGLPPHLRDYLIIWAVGSILGVTKDVGMVFTRRFDICRLQVPSPSGSQCGDRG
jgi:hypothetical protein